MIAIIVTAEVTSGNWRACSRAVSALEVSMAYGHIVNIMNMVLLGRSAIFHKRFVNFEAFFRTSKIQDLRWTRAFISNEKMCRKIIWIPLRILHLVNKPEIETSYPSAEGSVPGRRDDKMYQGVDISTKFGFSFDEVMGLMQRRADSANIPSSTYHASHSALRLRQSLRRPLQTAHPAAPPSKKLSPRELGLRTCYDDSN